MCVCVCVAAPQSLRGVSPPHRRRRRCSPPQQMAERGRTVRVSGLPADIEDERLRDKLIIHFLRARNGGGEIDSVTIAKATPVSALITFESGEGQWGQALCMSLHRERRVCVCVCGRGGVSE